MPRERNMSWRTPYAQTKGQIQTLEKQPKDLPPVDMPIPPGGVCGRGLEIKLCAGLFSVCFNRSKTWAKKAGEGIGEKQKQDPLG